MNKTDQQLQQIAEELARGWVMLEEGFSKCVTCKKPRDLHDIPCYAKMKSDLARHWLELNKGKEEGR